MAWPFAGGLGGLGGLGYPQPLPLPLPLPGQEKKAYFCQKCENHNIRHPRRNHKTECPMA